jgi:EAL domain-containing protein (putative c-di-GMP-specific phosphodiesterase class I)
LLAAVKQPVDIDGHEISISASLGIAIYPEDGFEPRTLQRNADAAMYSAKNSGRDRLRTCVTTRGVLDRVWLEQELRAGLRHGYFKLYYQPKFIKNGKLAGLEALARFDHPECGFISPERFIPVAEESGLIIQLGAWVLNEVCRQISDWQVTDAADVPVAINTSALELERADFATAVLECLHAHGVPPWNLELELTETHLLVGAEAANRQIQQLRSSGVRVFIDDFGTGYSALSCLDRLPVDGIKLDRSLVQSIGSNETARRLVHAIVGLGRGLDLMVVAEGVETEDQRLALATAGCEIMQGYLFGKPRPASELESLLHEGSFASNTLLPLASSLEAVGDRIPV